MKIHQIMKNLMLMIFNRILILFYDYLDLILTLTSYDERIRMMKILNTCNCCHRHNKNKPTLEQYMSGYVPTYSTSNIMNIYNCKCFCRTFARSLCRAQNDEIIID